MSPSTCTTRVQVKVRPAALMCSVSRALLEPFNDAQVPWPHSLAQRAHPSEVIGWKSKRESCQP